jgi:hypothetical protein
MDLRGSSLHTHAFGEFRHMCTNRPLVGIELYRGSRVGYALNIAVQVFMLREGRCKCSAGELRHIEEANGFGLQCVRRLACGMETCTTLHAARWMNGRVSVTWHVNQLPMTAVIAGGSS